MCVGLCVGLCECVGFCVCVCMGTHLFSKFQDAMVECTNAFFCDSIQSVSELG